MKVRHGRKKETKENTKTKDNTVSDRPSVSVDKGAVEELNELPEKAKDIEMTPEEKGKEMNSIVVTVEFSKDGQRALKGLLTELHKKNLDAFVDTPEDMVRSALQAWVDKRMRQTNYSKPSMILVRRENVKVCGANIEGNQDNEAKKEES
jgi:cell pole-organizing protein PopZ